MRYHLIATSRNLEGQMESIGRTDGNLLPLNVDITNEDEVKAAIETGIKAFGKIDVILNNAGYYLVGSIEKISDEEFSGTVDVNIFGIGNVIRQAMPYVRKQQASAGTKEYQQE